MLLLPCLLLPCLLLLAAPILAQTSAPEGPRERRLAVERTLLPSPWVEGHAFELLERMQALHVPGVSIAVVRDFEIDWAAGYGVRDAETGAPVTPETLFQAGSVSKPVAAMAALALARDGLLDLDASVNAALESWQLPAGTFTGEVTPRQILSHTGGLGVHGFPGYATFQPVPSLVEVLDGAGPANTEPIRRVAPAGSPMQYSGGGSTILQQAMIDASGKDFATLVRERVLAPLSMTRSTYEQPLPVAAWPDHSAGHLDDGLVQPGRFRVHPEQFAAGLWTTASDLARFVIDLQHTLAGDGERVLSRDLAWSMVTPVDQGPTGLGLFPVQLGEERWFEHGGSNIGFKALLRGSIEGGDAVIVLTNGEQGSRLAAEIARGVARVYGWPGVEDPLPAAADATDPAAYTGRYGLAPDDMVLVTADAEGLLLRRIPGPPLRLAPIGEHRFLLLGSASDVAFERSGEGAAVALTLRVAGRPGGQRAARLDDGEHWPVEDLLAGRVEEGLAFYREVHEADPDESMLAPGRLAIVAAGLWNDGLREAGIGVARLDVELHPDDPDALNTLARLLTSRGAWKEAARTYEALRAALDANPSSDDERRWLRSNAAAMADWLAKMP